MARRFKWTREEAIAYLKGTSFKPAKSKGGKLENYGTPELKRKASVYRKAELEQRAVRPGEHRGHEKIGKPIQPRAKIRHIERREQGPSPKGKGIVPARPEQYSVGTREQPVSGKQVERMLRSREKQRKKEGEAPIRGREAAGGKRILTGNITGILDMDYGQTKAGQPITLSFHIERDSLLRMLKDAGGDYVKFANMMGMAGGGTMGRFEGAHWVDVWQVNIVV